MQIDGVSVATWSPAALLAVAVLLILLGKIVPRRSVEDIIKDRDDWKAAYQLSERQRQEQSRQIDQLLEYGRTADQLLRSLPHPSHDLLPPRQAEDFRLAQHRDKQEDC